MFAELVGAVGWMHEIGLVHRDIKLESAWLPFPSLIFPLPLPRSRN